MRVPTTLGALSMETSCRLIGRGYAKTAVAVFMLGLTDTIPRVTQLHPWLVATEKDLNPTLLAFARLKALVRAARPTAHR
jgi:hypothetical protein